MTLFQALDNLEYEMLSEALKSSRGNMARAASTLDITYRIMGLRIKKHSMDPKKISFRNIQNNSR